MKGNDILLTQLEFLHDSKCLQNDNYNSEEFNAKAMQLWEDLNLPDKLKAAWNAYYLEFLQDPEGCLLESGVFYNEEDLMSGVIDKFYCFLSPIAKLASLQLRLQPYNFQVYVEPSFYNCSSVLIVTDLGDLRPDIVLYFYNYKAWTFYFDNISELYKYLESTYETIVRNYGYFKY